MIYCFDTYYYEDKAKTACLGITTWKDEYPFFEYSEELTGIEAYESGSFYKRELPCILNVLDKIELDSSKDVIVVDGFVVLDDEGKLGLGGYLFLALDQRIPIVGVAKNNFATLDKNKKEIYRGESKKPLFITSMGIDLNEAAKNVESMHGNYRFPTVLKQLDQNSRNPS